MFMAIDSNMYRYKWWVLLGIDGRSPVLHLLGFRTCTHFLKGFKTTGCPSDQYQYVGAIQEVSRWLGINTVVQNSCSGQFTTWNSSHEWHIPVQPHDRLHCFFDITYIFLNEQWYLTSKRVMKLAVNYTRVNVFSIYLLLFVYRCVLFFKTSPIFWEGFS